MTEKNPAYVARCQCGAVEISVWAQPMMVATCYCDDCQAAGQRHAALGGSAPMSIADGGTEFMVFRRDRVACTRGADRLQATKLTSHTKTRRMIASCCSTPMYVTFDDKRPWVSAFRAPFGAEVPPVEMRICTRFRRSNEIVDDGVRSHPGYPPAMMMRILAALPFMVFSKPVGTLP
jgi:hypothetical protein